MSIARQPPRAHDDPGPFPHPVPALADSFTPLARACFAPSAAKVARQMLGHYLVRRTPVGLAGGIIVETEAYLADDPACHGFNGETRRNRAMYGPPGRAYVYFIYGNHHCVNAVCREAGIAEAVLIRAVEPVFGLDWMQTRRGVKHVRDLTNGPGKLCDALDIGRALDGVDLCELGSPLFLAANPRLRATCHELGPVRVTPRIGITQAADWPLRFLLEGSRFVSRPAGGFRGKCDEISQSGASAPTATR